MFQPANSTQAIGLARMQEENADSIAWRTRNPVKPTTTSWLPTTPSFIKLKPVMIAWGRMWTKSTCILGRLYDFLSMVTKMHYNIFYRIHDMNKDIYHCWKCIGLDLFCFVEHYYLLTYKSRLILIYFGVITMIKCACDWGAWVHAWCVFLMI